MHVHEIVVLLIQGDLEVGRRGRSAVAADSQHRVRLRAADDAFIVTAAATVHMPWVLRTGGRAGDRDCGAGEGGFAPDRGRATHGGASHRTEVRAPVADAI